MPHGEPKTAKGLIDLLHHVTNGEDLYGLPSIMSNNACAGKADGTPCGAGCTCISQQPFYSIEAIQKFGIHPHRHIE